MKSFILGLLLVSFAHAQAPLCQSQLLKVTVANGALTGVTGRSALQFLRGLAPQLQELLKRDYDVETIPFPARSEECTRIGVNCPRNFCQDPSVSPELRQQLCFSLPCPIFEGTRNVGKCNGVENVFGSTIGFPTPVSIKRLSWEVKSIDTVGKEARLCFRINDLALNLSTSLTFDTSHTQLPDHTVTVENISGELDQPKEICATASIDFSSNTPIKNVRIIPQGDGPFISDNVIRAAAKTVRVTGLTGYPQRELERVVPELLPVLVQPLRQSIEQSVASALGDVLEKQVAEYLNNLDQHALVLDSESFISELSYTPTYLWQALAFHECRQLVLSGKSIPANHACIGQDVTFFDRRGSSSIENTKITARSDARFFYEVSTLGALISAPEFSYPNVVAESFRNRLLALRNLFEGRELSRDLTQEEGRKVLEERDQTIRSMINPFLESIQKKRETDNLFRNVEVNSELAPGVQREIGLAIPGICNSSPSSISNVSIPNCPIQAFVDLNQFNAVLTSLWEKGRVCSDGKGTDCTLPTDLITCKLVNSPQLRYLGASGRYSTSLQLRKCSKDILPFGLFGAKIGGDFNVSLTFKPKACNNGDFCIDQPQVTWTLLRGSEEGWLKDPFLKRKVTEKINSSIHEAMSKTFRIPFASATSGFMSEIPLKSEGRTKTGAGYFGVCLKEDR